MTRRELLALLGTSPLFGQGMSRRSVKPLPRGKPSGLPFHARFTDVAAAAGLREPVIYGRAERKDYLVETVGCGVAFLDFDNDGWLDIFVLGGSRLSGAPAGATNRLYRNNRDGTFIDVTEKAGLRHTGWASSVAVGDFNNDGFDDLFVTGWGQNTLYRNNGDGTFTDITEKAGLLQKANRWGSGCTFVDYNRDGLLDLLVAHYTDFDLQSVPRQGEAATCNWKGVPVPCGPRGLPPGGLNVYRNHGDGTDRKSVV
jgi:enediyne biosynthesis protein E4